MGGTKSNIELITQNEKEQKGCKNIKMMISSQIHKWKNQNLTG